MGRHVNRPRAQGRRGLRRAAIATGAALLVLVALLVVVDQWRFLGGAETDWRWPEPGSSAEAGSLEIEDVGADRVVLSLASGRELVVLDRSTGRQLQRVAWPAEGDPVRQAVLVDEGVVAVTGAQGGAGRVDLLPASPDGGSRPWAEAVSWSVTAEGEVMVAGYDAPAGVIAVLDGGRLTGLELSAGRRVWAEDAVEGSDGATREQTRQALADQAAEGLAATLWVPVPGGSSEVAVADGVRLRSVDAPLVRRDGSLSAWQVEGEGCRVAALFDGQDVAVPVLPFPSCELLAVRQPNLLYVAAPGTAGEGIRSVDLVQGKVRDLGIPADPDPAQRRRQAEAFGIGHAVRVEPRAGGGATYRFLDPRDGEEIARAGADAAGYEAGLGGQAVRRDVPRWRELLGLSGGDSWTVSVVDPLTGEDGPRFVTDRVQDVRDVRVLDDGGLLVVDADGLAAVLPDPAPGAAR